MSWQMRLAIAFAEIVFLIAYFAVLCFTPAVDIRYPAYDQVPVPTPQEEQS